MLVNPTPWRPPMRQTAALSAGRRRRLHIERDDLLVRLEALDRQVDGHARDRVELVRRLVGLRDTLWPPMPGWRTRRPPVHDQPALPPIPAGAQWLSGRPLRVACLALLHRRGAMALPDLHAGLHHAGYAVASPRPVQALADAMGYEVEEGRAVRVRRGVYAPQGAPPEPGPDPVRREWPPWGGPSPGHGDQGTAPGRDAGVGGPPGPVPDRPTAPRALPTNGLPACRPTDPRRCRPTARVPVAVGPASQAFSGTGRERPRPAAIGSGVNGRGCFGALRRVGCRGRLQQQGPDASKRGLPAVATDVFEPLRLEYLRQDGTVVVRVTGEVDVATSPVLRDELVKLIDDQGNLSVQLDLQGLSFIDSTGIGVLVGLLRRLRDKGGDLTLANPRPSTMRVLEIVGLTQVFEIRVDGATGAEGADRPGPASG